MNMLPEQVLCVINPLISNGVFTSAAVLSKIKFGQVFSVILADAPVEMVYWEFTTKIKAEAD